MSWGIFKQNILRYANDPKSLKDTEDIARVWATEYDAAIKRGYDNVNLVSVKQGNVDLMTELLKIAFDRGLTSKQPYDLVGAMGDAVKAYWSGALLNEFPIPIVPAPGSTSNIATTTNIVLNVGIWPPQIIIPSVDASAAELSEEQLSASIVASLDGLPIGEATGEALQSTPTSRPHTSLEAAKLRLKVSLDPRPITPPTSDALREEARITLNTSISQVSSNYKGNINVPQDVVLAMRRWGIGINNIRERAHFLSQCSHESGGFRAKVENLNYGASGLLNIFSKYFNGNSAEQYQRNPQRIASRVYANRMDNGSEASGEGWKYRGRGYIQLTGKANYKAMQRAIGDTLGVNIVNNPDKVETDFPADSACYFWTANKLSNLITQNDDESIKILTKRINGGQNGLEDRYRKFLMYLSELQKDSTLWS